MRRKSLASLVLLIACTPLSEAQRSALEADAEAFESIVRSQVADSAAGALGFLRVDARPSEDDAVLAGTVEPPRAIDLGQSPDSLSPLMSRIEDQRRSILGTLKVDEGGPFDFPYCGGARRVSDSSEADTLSKCPRQPVRYVTVGAPYHGAAPLLAKLRRPELPVPDSSAELWTLLVSETNVGPGGQQWRQYAWLFRRDRDTARLVVAERFLVSWAE
ncbi:MAG TPA: hypothetical protein VLJ83_06595 [Gemmatimonadaceae bacterium]|nr:hypothetical protein [Gemmatimonadaceae bacterium]